MLECNGCCVQDVDVFMFDVGCFIIFVYFLVVSVVVEYFSLLDYFVFFFFDWKICVGIL